MPEFTPGLYRWRTKMRIRSPEWFSFAFPKGRHECGNHEWYNADNLVERCYHCEAERPRQSPAG